MIPLDIEEYAKKNIFIFNTQFNTEKLTENEIEKILTKLNQTFETVQKQIKYLIDSGQSGKYIFFTTNSKLQNLIDFPYAPIYDEAIHSFMKSLTKEYNSFNLTFYAICLEPIAEMLEKDEKFQYRKKMKNVASKKTPTKIEDLMQLLNEIINSKTTLLSGTIFTVGEGICVVNKIVLITGGTKGIGREITKAFLDSGAKVFTIYSSDDAAAKEIATENLFLHKGSVSDANFLKTVFSDIKQKFGRLDILINNAGINRDGLFMYMKPEDWQTVFDVNIKGTFLTSLYAKDLMKPKSFIVNISSISGIYGRAGQINYSTSKGAILGITRLFAKRYAPLGINVNTLIPGMIETDMTKDLPEKITQEINSATLLNRMGKPSEITTAVLFLASDAASYITGTSLFVDGGFIK